MVIGRNKEHLTRNKASFNSPHTHQAGVNSQPHWGRKKTLRLVAKALFVAVFLHALAPLVFCDFRFSFLF